MAGIGNVAHLAHACGDKYVVNYVRPWRSLLRNTFICFDCYSRHRSSHFMIFAAGHQHLMILLAVAQSQLELASHANNRSEEHTSELQSLMRISYAVFCLKTKHKRLKQTITNIPYTTTHDKYKH